MTIVTIYLLALVTPLGTLWNCCTSKWYCNKSFLAVWFTFVSVVLGCGGSTSQNCSYFQSSANTLQSGQCTLKICKCSTDICQVYVFWCSSKLIRRIWEQTMKKCIRIRTNTTFYLTQFNPL